jgi:hypothetical protein
MKPRPSSRRHPQRKKKSAPQKVVDKNPLPPSEVDTTSALDLSAVTLGDFSVVGNVDAPKRDEAASEIAESPSEVVATSAVSTCATLPKRKHTPTKKPQGPPVVAVSDISRTYLNTLLCHSKTPTTVSLVTICKQLSIPFVGRKEKVIDRILSAVERISTYTSVPESVATTQRVSLSFRQLITSKMQDNQTKTAVLATGRSPSALSALFSRSYLPVLPEPLKKTRPASKGAGKKKRRAGPKSTKKDTKQDLASLIKGSSKAQSSLALEDPKIVTFPGGDSQPTEGHLNTLGNAFVGNQLEKLVPSCHPMEELLNRDSGSDLPPSIGLKEQMDRSRLMDSSNEVLLCASADALSFLETVAFEEATVSRALCDNFNKLSLLRQEEMEVEVFSTSISETTNGH